MNKFKISRCSRALFSAAVALMVFLNVSRGAVRVALMDFSTADNSYRSIQAAADFATLVQIGLADEPEIEWVERAKIDVAKHELSLAEMNGASPLKRGRMLGANWLVTGHFSTDDQERPMWSFQIIELEHADVIASDSIMLVKGEAGAVFGTAQVESAVGGLRRLLAEARANELQARSQRRIAFLFFANVSRDDLDGGPRALGREFSRALERSAKTNNQVRLVKFPKAYQATEEAALVADGLIEPNGDAWQQTADLYVWGKYGVTNSYKLGRRESKLNVELNLWDGNGEPVVIREMLSPDVGGQISAGRLSELVERMVARVAAGTGHVRTNRDLPAVRQAIAASLVETYVGMVDPHGTQLGLDDKERFVEAVHLLETACFFDPQSAKARLLWITTRYGWWMDFGSDVKNVFWSKWRRSQAWGEYMDRFGLKPPGVNLSFPYEQEGLPTTCLRAAEDVVKSCPQNFDWSEDEEYGPMKEAQRHGFPKDISNAAAAKWKAELEREAWKRLTKIVELIQRGEWTPPKNLPPTILSDVVRVVLGSNKDATERLALLEKVWPECAKCAQKFGPQWIMHEDDEKALVELCAKAGKPARGGELKGMLARHDGEKVVDSSQSPPVEGRSHQNISKPPILNSAVKPESRAHETEMVATPEWMKGYMSLFQMFKLYPPNALPTEAKPDIQIMEFSKNSEVQVIRQMTCHAGELWILAMDERSSPTSAAKPDIAGERKDKVSRLWSVKEDDTRPILFKAEELPSTIETMVFRDEELWLGGDAVSVLNLRSHKVRRFGIAEGLTLQEVEALAAVDGRMVAAGGTFDVEVWENSAQKWTRLALPSALLSHDSGNGCSLAGSGQWLGYTAGSALFHNFCRGTWTNVAELEHSSCLAAEGQQFFAGSDYGLGCFDVARGWVEKWNAPVFIQSPMGNLVGSTVFMSGPRVSRQALEQAEARVRAGLKNLEDSRNKAQVAKARGGAPEPFNLNYRIPGAVAALAQDGEYLWLGVNNYFGSYLMLLHKPTLSLVASHTMGVRERISSLAVSEKYVWAGTAYGDNALLQMNKSAFLSVPRNQWVSLTITPEERKRLIGSMSTSDQALYAFYAGDDARVVELLKDLNPTKAGWAEMFLLAHSYDASGVDDVEKWRLWCDRICANDPETPWAKHVRAAAKANEVAHEQRHAQTLALSKFDRNHDGKLDETETRAMKQDPEFAKVQSEAAQNQLRLNMEQLIARYDRDGDTKLDASEAASLCHSVSAFREANKTMPGTKPRNAALLPLLLDNFPAEPELMRRFDANHDGKLEAAELQSAANELGKNKR